MRVLAAAAAAAAALVLHLDTGGGIGLVGAAEVSEPSSGAGGRARRPDPSDWISPASYWVAPLDSLGLSCVDSNIKAGNDVKPGPYACLTVGEAICIDNDGGSFGHWTFGIKKMDDDTTHACVWDPKGEPVWCLCDDSPPEAPNVQITHVCIGEDVEFDKTKHSQERPYLTFYDEKTHMNVAELTCDGTDGEDDENLDKPTMLKMVDNSNIGQYAKYPVTVVKLKKGQTEDPKDGNDLWQVVVKDIGNSILNGTWSYDTRRCTWTDVCPSASPSGMPSDIPSDTPSGAPSDIPSDTPSGAPSDIPSDTPSGAPSGMPSGMPSNEPSSAPADACAVVNCLVGESCNPLTCLCEDDDQLVPCVAVIDEDDAFRTGSPAREDQEELWGIFRNSYPSRPFCLLVPNVRNQVNIPQAFTNDPNAIVRYNILRGGDSNPEDWVSYCGLDAYTSNNVEFVGLFVDNSGSMRRTQVLASINKFKADLGAKNIEVKEVANRRENWIAPFLTTLVPAVLTSSPSDAPTATVSEGPSLGPSLSLVPTTFASEEPSLGPTSSPVPSFNPTSPIPIPLLLPSVSPSQEPSVTPSDVPSSTPSQSPSQEPSSDPSSAPSDMPSVVPSDEPSLSPSISPSSEPPSEPSKMPPSMPSTDPSYSPSFLPSNEPSPSPPILAIILTAAAITAGDMINATLTLQDSDGSPIDPLPTITYSITFVPSEASGTPPTVSSASPDAFINTFDDTRGVFSINAIVDGTSLSSSEDFVVLPPASQSEMDRIYAELSATVNGAGQSLTEMDRAAVRNDVPSIQKSLDELRAFRDSIDLAEIRVTSICAPEEGFFPSSSQLTAAGFPKTADDFALKALVKNLIANFVNFANALDLGSDLSVLDALNEQALLLADEFDSLNPTVHGWVLAQEGLNYLYAIAFPRYIHTQVDVLERTILDENVGVIRHLSSHNKERRAIFSLAGLTAAGALRMNIVTNLYGALISDLARISSILALDGLLREYGGDLSEIQVITGGFLSINCFQRTRSTLEVNGANQEYPERTDVYLIGTDAISTVQTLITSLKPSKFKNLSEVFDYTKGLLDSIDGVVNAADRANQTPTGFGGLGCIFFDGPDCVSLEFQNGFTPVITCESFLCTPQPVLFLVRNLDDGRSGQDLFNFLASC